MYFSGHHGRTAHTLSFREGFPCIKETMEDEDIVLPFFGYIDVKNCLPKFSNTKEVINKYVNNISN